ncbi:hypothetical protein AB0A73_24430 [Glycomyces sp. NPDC047369]
MNEICENCGWPYFDNGSCNCCPICGEFLTDHTPDEYNACDVLEDLNDALDDEDY